MNQNSVGCVNKRANEYNGVAEMRFPRPVEEYRKMGHEHNKSIRKELTVTDIKTINQKSVKVLIQDFKKELLLKVSICKAVSSLLGFIHRLNYKIIKSQHFGSWIMLPYSRKKEHTACLLDPTVDLVSDLG